MKSFTEFLEELNYIPESVEADILWKELVPASGKAKTPEGELLRMAGRCNYEICNNGGGNNRSEELNYLKKNSNLFTKYLKDKSSLSVVSTFLTQAVHSLNYSDLEYEIALKSGEDLVQAVVAYIMPKHR